MENIFPCGRNVHSPGTSREQVEDIVRVLVPLGEDLARAVPFHWKDVIFLLNIFHTC